MLHTCDECGLRYVEGSAEDEESHRRKHKEYAQGPTIAAIHSTPILGTPDDFALHLVDGSVETSIREKVAYVAEVAQRSMPNYPAGYYGTVTEEDQRLYVATDGDRAIGFVLTANLGQFWHFYWQSGGGLALKEPESSLLARPTVMRVWVAANYRRKCLAKRLVMNAASHISVEPSSMGWELPFTQQGEALVRSVCPESFFGSCDMLTLRQILHPGP